MSQILNQQHVHKLGTILSIWAHPDDETFLSGGLMRAARANGQQVVCITATRGEKGVYNPAIWPADTMAATRTRELQQALQILGVEQHHWLGCVDGECAKNDHRNDKRRLREWIRYYKPDTILTFGPDGWTGHPDHQSISDWVIEAVERIEHEPAVYHAVTDRKVYQKYLRKLDEDLNIFFNTDEPPLKEAHQCTIHFTLPEEAITAKIVALKAMPSQTSRIFESADHTLIAKALGQECFCQAKKVV